MNDVHVVNVSTQEAPPMTAEAPATKQAAELSTEKSGVSRTRSRRSLPTPPETTWKRYVSGDSHATTVSKSCGDYGAPGGLGPQRRRSRALHRGRNLPVAGACCRAPQRSAQRASHPALAAEGRIRGPGGRPLGGYPRVAEGSGAESSRPLLLPDGTRPRNWAQRRVCRDHHMWLQFDDPLTWYVIEI